MLIKKRSGMEDKKVKRYQKGLVAELHTCTKYGLFFSFFFCVCQKAWPMTAIPHTITVGQRHGKNGVWLSVFYPVTWEEIISTKTNGNSDSFPST